MNASEKLEYELLAGRYSPLEGYDGFVDKLQEMQDYYYPVERSAERGGHVLVKRTVTNRLQSFPQLVH